jgi:glycosyltransferase involved in cell wall biosynthesis
MLRNLDSKHDARPHILWVGQQFMNFSLALVSREIECALLESQKVCLSISPVGKDDQEFIKQLDPKYRILTSCYHRQSSSPVDVTIRHEYPPNPFPPTEGHWVLMQPWEFGGLPIVWVERANSAIDEVWVPSNFVRDVYIESGFNPARVQVVPHGIDAHFFQPDLEPLKLATSKTFKILFVGRSIHRKGIDILLDAYQQSFKPSDDVVLVIKDVKPYAEKNWKKNIQDLQKDPDIPAICYSDRNMSDREMAQLYNACDCLVLPYRGEGFGIPVLEAMACSLPVVVTAGGATDDFVDDSTGYRIPAKKQVFGNRQADGLATAVDLWRFEPDVEALGQMLIHIFENRQEAAIKGARARQAALRWPTWNQVAEQVVDRIDVIRSRPITRLQHRAGGANIGWYSALR